MKKDVVMSDLTSPWYSPAFTPGETSSFLRYLLFQLSTKIEKKKPQYTKGYITVVNQSWTYQYSGKCMPKYLAQWDFVKYGLLAMAISKCNQKG